MCIYIYIYKYIYIYIYIKYIIENPAPESRSQIPVYQRNKLKNTVTGKNSD